MIGSKLQNLFSLFDEGIFVGLTTACPFGSFGCFGVDQKIFPVSLIFMLFLNWSRCSGLVCLSYLIRFIWLLWIGSFYKI